ncbi:hypothetical protein [Diaphorobacter nitroreducens]
MFSTPAAVPQVEPGEAIFVGSGGATQSWVVPTGVYSISVVAVGATATTACQLKRGAAVLLDTTAAIGVGNDGGGNGGAAGTNNTGLSFYNSYNSGGGAGGYSGNGGTGGLGRFDSSIGGFGGSGNGGGGGGGNGGGGNGSQMTSYGTTGGGVGLFGQGANGGSAANGSPIQSPYVGGGANNNAGGNLRYRNNIAVTPGETLTIALGSALATQPLGPGMRIIWGANRAFPANNCGPTVPQSQVVLSSNTTWTVPAGVTTIHACAQGRSATSDVSLVVGGATVLRAMNGARVGDGGGDGGFPGVAGDTDTGGGAAGGYSGNGGNGGKYTEGADTNWYGNPGTAGNGGAAGGGASASRTKQPVFGGQPASYKYTPTGYGGGVGISGTGSNGSGGSVGNNPDGGGGSPDPINGLMGGGSPGQRGSALAWKNNIAVTPGQVLTVNASAGRIRIIWGPGRSYPSSAGDV